MKYIILFSFLTGGIAQSYDWNDEKLRGRRSLEKMENMIVWRLTDELTFLLIKQKNFSQDLENIGKV